MLGGNREEKKNRNGKASSAQLGTCSPSPTMESALVSAGAASGVVGSWLVSDSASPWEQLRLANRLGLIISRLPGLNCKMNSSFCTLGLGASSKD